MIWSFNRKIWFITSLAGSLIALISTSIMIGVSRYYDYNNFIPALDAFAFVFCIFSIIILAINLVFAFKPSVMGFLISLLVAAFSILYQSIYGIVVITSINSFALGSTASDRWDNAFIDLTLDKLQEKLYCCGFDSHDDRHGRNGFCYRDDLDEQPLACKDKIASTIVIPYMVSAFLLVGAGGCNIAAFVFAILLRKSDPNDEISPDNESMLAAGLL